jgi:hypothetical protein
MRNRASGGANVSPAQASIHEHPQEQPLLLRPARDPRLLAQTLAEFEAGTAGPAHSADMPAGSWDFAAMGRYLNKPEPAEPDLVENIARAMRKPTLMRRLASVEAEYTSAERAAVQAAPLLLPSPHAAPLPPPLPDAALSASLQSAAEAAIAAAPARDADVPRSERQSTVEADEPFVMPPHLAEWIGKSETGRGRAIINAIAAWFATLFIGGMIIAAMVLVLQR